MISNVIEFKPNYLIENGEAFNLFLDYFKNHRKKTATTILAYTKNLRAFAKWINENGINNPTAKDLDLYISSLEEQGLKPNTIQAYLNTLKQFYKFLSFQYGIKNIAEGLQTTNKNDPTEFKKDYLRVNQVKDLLAQFKESTKLTDIRNYALISLLVCCGLRTIEIERANIEDLKIIDDKEARLYIQGKGKGDKKKYVKVPTQVLEALKHYLFLREDINGASPLFTNLTNNNSNGARLTKGSISRIVKTSLRAIGLESDKLTAHSLRHTTATLNLLNGGTLEETQQLLRHSNINTTLIYSHALEREKNNSESRIANSIF